MLVKLYSHDNDPRLLNAVSDKLNQGGIMIYPTDSGYAIGCNALKQHAIERICDIKGLIPTKSHFSIICYDLSEISKYTHLDNNVFKLIKRNLPGPFTFILEGSNQLPKLFRNRKTIGIRMPDSPIVLELARFLGAPIMTTSLPMSDEESPENVSDPELIDEEWGNRVDVIIDGGIVNHDITTIVDCTGSSPEIIREGMGEIVW